MKKIKIFEAKKKKRETNIAFSEFLQVLRDLFSSFAIQPKPKRETKTKTPFLTNPCGATTITKYGYIKTPRDYTCKLPFLDGNLVTELSKHTKEAEHNQRK